MLRRVLFALTLLSLSAAAVQSDRPALGATLVFQTDMTGSQVVPPVNTVAYGFVRFFFDDSRLNADYTVDVKGLSGSIGEGADIHRGLRGSNGPVIKHLADGGFIVTSGKLHLTQAELNEMMSGDWYVTVSSAGHPAGEMRGQIVLPADFLPTPTPQPPPPPALNQPLEALPPQEGAPVTAPSLGSNPGPPSLPPSLRILPPNTGDAGLKPAR